MRRIVTCVVGTRPEAVKMAPVIHRLRRDGSGIACRVIASGQHQGLLDQALGDFGLKADRNLHLMRPGQDLTEMTARALSALGQALDAERPDLVLAVGDTTTVLAAAMAAQFRRIPFGHVEAGLRTFDRSRPFPEELNRGMVARLSDLHFAPTHEAAANLRAERVASESIYLTGNPVIDALRMTARRAPSLPIDPPARHFLLATAHRRENWGKPLVEIALGLRDLLDRNPALGLIVPMHPNPEVRKPLRANLENHPRARLIEPVNYPEFVALMGACRAILTDSGGVQEEGPALGKPVLILRAETERPEALTCGLAQLVGADRQAIVAATEAILSRPIATAPPALPFGDGWAAERIARAVAGFLKLDPGPIPSDLPEWGEPLRRSA